MQTLEVALLMRLMDKGLAKEGRRNTSLIQRYRSAGWLEPTTRRDEWAVRLPAREALLARLAALLPSWAADAALLRQLGLDPYDAADVACLPRLRSQRTAFAFLNRRNWMAATGLGPKHAARLPAPGQLTKDWVMRLRASVDLQLAWPDRIHPLQALTEEEGEALVTERQWRRRTGWAQSGHGPQHVTVVSLENRGAYIDTPLVPGCVYVESPGWNVETTIELLKSLEGCRWLHFGDLDVEGLAIATHIADATWRPLRFYVPSFAQEYMDVPQGSRLTWPAHASGIPGLAPFVAARLGVSQEAFVIDPRLARDLEAFVNADRP
ncbi:DUF2399 domain-containing protein [Roseateles paludis]|jgi:hypothetical protein|uniref:DUF2399 domain-containing protein n=1 Tax=Roseateles paludis TaxID=3145238 RepID=A0ABV0FWI9_9BURK